MRGATGGAVVLKKRKVGMFRQVLFMFKMYKKFVYNNTFGFKNYIIILKVCILSKNLFKKILL